MNHFPFSRWVRTSSSELEPSPRLEMDIVVESRLMYSPCAPRPVAMNARIRSESPSMSQTPFVIMSAMCKMWPSVAGLQDRRGTRWAGRQPAAYGEDGHRRFG
jgi:hypothetical protein